MPRSRLRKAAHDEIERLIDFLDIGHAVQNTARQRLGFSLQEAIAYLSARRMGKTERPARANQRLPSGAARTTVAPLR
jgi:hypothetical protein